MGRLLLCSGRLGFKIYSFSLRYDFGSIYIGRRQIVFKARKTLYILIYKTKLSDIQHPFNFPTFRNHSKIRAAIFHCDRLVSGIFELHEPFFVYLLCGLFKYLDAFGVVFDEIVVF